MRVKVLKLNQPTTDGRLVVTVTWRQEPLPVMWDQAIVGWLREVRQDADHWITAELTTHEDFDPTGLCVQADLDHIQTHPHDGDLVITTGRIYGAVLGSNPCWSGMEIAA